MPLKSSYKIMVSHSFWCRGLEMKKTTARCPGTPPLWEPAGTKYNMCARQNQKNNMRVRVHLSSSSAVHVDTY